ncbi:MAG TPA: hypothetical protein VD884_10450 [Ohtaekwangia sp.]|nr:hypothetical protein [Ohtaekwangia sp.]
MKTKSLFLAALVTLSAVVSAVGKDEPRTAVLAVVPQKGSEVFKVIYKSEAQSRIKMNIYNAAAQLIYTESFTGIDGFIRPVNFSQLSAGEYTIEMIDAVGKTTQKINYAPVKPAPKNIHISSIGKDDQKFLVSVADAGEETITIRIYDNLSNLIHAEKQKVNGDFAQVYVVKSTGNVTIEVSDEAGNIKSNRF